MHLNLPSILPRILLTADAQPSLHDGRKALVSEPVAFYKRHTFQLTHTQTYQVIPTLNSVTGMIDNGAYDMMMSLWFDGAGSVDQSGQIRCARLQNDRFFFTRVVVEVGGTVSAVNASHWSRARLTLVRQ